MQLKFKKAILNLPMVCRHSTPPHTSPHSQIPRFLIPPSSHSFTLPCIYPQSRTINCPFHSFPLLIITPRIAPQALYRCKFLSRAFCLFIIPLRKYSRSDKCISLFLILNHFLAILHIYPFHTTKIVYYS